MPNHWVCKVDELPIGSHRIVNVEGRSIGLFNVEGSFYALLNQCPHKGAPLCKGTVSGTTLPSRPGQFIYGHAGCILRCPWHGWEFNISTGKSFFNPHRMKVKTFAVTRETSSSIQIEVPRTVLTEKKDPSVESFKVSVEEEWVVLNL